MNLRDFLLSKIRKTQKDKILFNSTYTESLEWSRSETEPQKAGFPQTLRQNDHWSYPVGSFSFYIESLCPLPQMGWVTVALQLKYSRTL